MKKKIVHKLQCLVGFGRCGCGRIRFLKKRRLNTAFVNEEKNFLTSCKDCYEEAIAYYQDLWNSIY